MTEGWETQTAIDIAEELNSPQTTLELKNLSKARSDAVDQSESVLNQKLAEVTAKTGTEKEQLEKEIAEASDKLSKDRAAAAEVKQAMNASEDTAGAKDKIGKREAELMEDVRGEIGNK